MRIPRVSLAAIMTLSHVSSAVASWDDQGGCGSYLVESYFWDLLTPPLSVSAATGLAFVWTRKRMRKLPTNRAYRVATVAGLCQGIFCVATLLCLLIVAVQLSVPNFFIKNLPM